VHYDSYEFYSGTGGVLTASLCPSDGGSADFDAFLAIYQTPNGGRMNPFVPDACNLGIAANDDSCGLLPAITYFTLSPGYYYVVVTAYANNGTGTYNLVVKSNAVCSNATPTPCPACPTATATGTRTATRTVTVTPTGTRPPNCAPSTTFVSIVNFAFSPQNVTIYQGQTVYWSNDSNTTHTTSSNSGTWYSGWITAGSFFAFTFNNAGTFPYHCDFHPGTMTGTITVLPGCQPTATPTRTRTPTITPTGTVPATPTACAQYRVGKIVSGDPSTYVAFDFPQGVSCDPATNVYYAYYEAYEFYLETTSDVAVLGTACVSASAAIYQASGGAPIPNFVPSGCTNAVASSRNLNLKATLNAGYYYLVVSSQYEYSYPNYSFSVTAEPFLTRSGTLDTSDRVYLPPGPFNQGSACILYPGSQYVRYDTHEFYLSSPSVVIASTCGLDAGSSFITAPIVALYQAPGGAQMPGFAPDRCEYAVTAAQNNCGGGQARATSSLGAGYFYVVVSGSRNYDSYGKYTLSVLGATSCATFALTPVPTGTPPTALPTRTMTTTTTPTITPTCQPTQLVIGASRSYDKPAPVQKPKGAEANIHVEPVTPGDKGTPFTLSDNLPAVFQLDDGTPEQTLGYGDAYYSWPSIWLNRFTPPAGSYPITLQNIYVFWPSGASSLIGSPVRLLVYSDLDGDNYPGNAILVGEVPATISLTGAFQTYPVTITVPGPTGDIYIGFEDSWAESLPYRRNHVAQDTNNSTARRSWVASGGNYAYIDDLSWNSTLGIIDDVSPSYPGNWMIRASGTTALPGGCPPTPTGTLTYTPTGTQPTSTRTATPPPTRTQQPAPPWMTYTPTRTHTANPTPTFCAAQQLLVEGFESGTLDLFSSVATATPTTIPAGWRAVTTTSYLGNYSAFAPDLGTLSEQWLTNIDAVSIPVNATRAVLSFRHRYEFESVGQWNYDGGVLELSTDGGATWISAGYPNNYITAGDYNGLVLGTNIMGQVYAWTGSTSGQFVHVEVNLMPFAGRNLRFRFRLGTDPSVGREGWYIDDINLAIGGPCGSLTPTPTATFTVTTTPLPCLVVPTSSDVPKAIPDFANGVPGVVTLTLSLSGVGSIYDIDVIGLVISHTWIGDLQVSLTSPGGTTVLLVDRVCNGGANADLSNITLDDAGQPMGAVCPPTPNAAYRPSNPLSAFYGQGASGTWTLTVRDLATQDTGTLQAWGLRVASLSPCVVSTPTPTGTPSLTRTNTPMNTPTNTPTRTQTLTPTPTVSALVGHLTWQGISQPNTRNQGLTATLSLCVGGAPQSQVVTTDQNGNFAITTTAGPGTYNWWIKGRKWLANAGTLTLPASESVEFGTQRSGDANNTNIVNTIDFNILKTTFGKGQGDPGYDERADFNNDQLANSTDFNSLKANFGLAGAGTNCP
jgi:plastocyanin/subtilisin-like proprotein convertase family protein